MKLFSHLYIYLLVGIVVLICVDEYLSFRAEIVQYESDMISNSVQLGHSISGMIAHAWQENGEDKARQLIRDASSSGTITIRWMWPEQELESFTGSDCNRKHLQQVALGKGISFKNTNSDGVILLYTYVPVDVGTPQSGALELSQTMTSLNTFRKQMIGRAINMILILSFISGLILFLFTHRKIHTPLSSLMHQARRIGAGDLSANTPVTGDDELAELAETMNDMCSRLLIAKDKIQFEYDARVKMLEQLRHTEKLSSCGVLSAEIAHELGTPLNVVDGRAKMIIREELSPEQIQDCAVIIQTQVERMTTIIRQLLNYTRQKTPKKTTEDVSFHVKQIFQLLYPMADKQGVTFIIEREEETKTVLTTDFSGLQQVIVNLLINAIQAMPDGGKIEVLLSNEKITSGRDNATRKYLKINIQDEGEGIREEHLSKLFTPFFTTKTIGTGTGLGLSIAHGIIEENNGWIDTESKLQDGACFSVYLPLQE